MTILKFGQEGESIPKNSVLNTSIATVDIRGGVEYFKYGWSQFDADAIIPDVWYSGIFQTTRQNVPNSPYGIPEFFAIRDEFGNILLNARTRRLSNPDVPILYFEGVFDDTTSRSTLLTYGDFATTPHKIAFHIARVGTTLTMEVYFDGSKIAARTVVGVAPTWGTPATFAYGCSDAGNDSVRTLWADVCISDTPTIGLEFTTLEGTAQGFHTAANGLYTAVVEPGVELSSVLTFSNIGDKESWIVTPLAGKAFTSEVMQTLVLSALVVKASGPVTGFQFFIRSGGVDYLTAGGIHPMPLVMNNITEDVAVNPVTGVDWTTVEVSAGIEIGIVAT